MLRYVVRRLLQIPLVLVAVSAIIFFALRLGPFRINLSQHGVGLSAGVTGARFGLDASGHPYVHAGRRGLYYRKRWPVPSRC